MASIAKTAEQHDTSRTSESRNLRRVACCLTIAGGQLWAAYFAKVKSLIESGQYRPICFAKKRRYDETPLRIRIEEEEKNLALPEAPTEGQVGVAGKVLQTEFEIMMLLEDIQNCHFFQVVGKAPTWLQVLSTTRAECIKHAQLQIEDNIANLQEIAKMFPMCCNLPCTDMHSSNICVEKSFQHDNPNWVDWHSHCLIHKLGRCVKSMMSLVEGHVSGVLAIGKSLEFAGTTKLLRKHLADILVERVEVHIATPQSTHYREAIYDLLLGFTNTTSRKQKTKPLLKKKQRFILEHLMNGDIQIEDAVRFCASQRLDRQVLLRMMHMFVVPALVPHACPTINRSSFLGYENAIHWCALLASHHNLLTPLLLRFYGVKSEPKANPPAKSNPLANSWMGLALANISAYAHTDAAEISTASALVDVAPTEKEEEATTQQQQEFDDKNIDWHAKKKATKAKASQYVASKPGDVLIVLSICMEPINHLTQAFIKLSAEGFDRAQERRVLRGQSRTFRVLECWRGKQIGQFNSDLEKLMKSIHPALPAAALTESMRSLMFRLLARAGSAVEHHVTSYHRGCPFSLFGVLEGDTDTVLETRPCMRDQLTTTVLKKYPSEGSLLSAECMSLLVALATIIDIDILGIEARHSATRRLVVAKSVQTWPIHMQNLSGEWVIRQHRIWKEFAQRGKPKGKMKPKKRRAYSRKGGGGGAWRAFCRHHLKGCSDSSSHIEFFQW